MSTNQKRDDLWFSNTMRTEIWINLFGLPRRVVGLSALQGTLSVDCIPHGVVSSGVSSRNFCFYELHVFLFVFYVYNSDIAGGFRKGSSDQITFIITTSTMETTERNSAVRRNADDQTTINQGAIFLKVAD